MLVYFFCYVGEVLLKKIAPQTYRVPFFFQFFFSYLDKGYAAFMAGQELDELGEYDNEFVQNISKFANFESK